MQTALDPALDQTMAAILARLQREDADMPDPTLLQPDQAREIAELTNRRWNRSQPPLQRIDDIAFSSTDDHDTMGRLFTPEDPSPGLIMYIHGGGFALCSIDTHERAARTLAIEANCAVLSVAYRLAPEHPFPAGLNNCIHAYRRLSEVRDAFEWTRGPTAISGDSAGANLALALMLSEQGQGGTLPDFAMLFYGVYDVDFRSPSYLKYEMGPGLTRAKMMRYFDWYAPEYKRGNPLICPIRASDAALKTLPPLYLNAAEIDPLLSDTQALAARLSKLGRRDQVRIHHGVVHGFMQMTSSLPAAQEATSEAAQAFRKHVALPKTLNQ